MCTSFGKAKPCFIIQDCRTKLVKTANLQAHNASRCEALCACRSAVFTSLVHFIDDKYKTNGFGHTRFPPNNDDMLYYIYGAGSENYNVGVPRIKTIFMG